MLRRAVSRVTSSTRTPFHSLTTITTPAAPMSSSVPVKLTHDQIKVKLADVPEWKFSSESRDLISRRFVFADFSEALGFMVETGVKCDKMNHHPEWFNVYNRVDVTFTTHDCAGVSQNDFDAAAFFDTAFAARQRK